MDRTDLQYKIYCIYIYCIFIYVYCIAYIYNIKNKDN